uniref:Uncharacterized protein n=1 Tax=Sipha flava TaxID=143950 RepID=A0A2S2R787_9HEMI
MDQETSTNEKSEIYNEEKEDQNTTNGTNVFDCSFFPKDLLLEEKRLKEEHEEKFKTEVNLLKNFDENERKERFQNLLTLLENSTKLTMIFENRLKMCKQQIIKKELEKSKLTKKNILSKEAGLTKKSEGIDEEKYFV